MNSARKDLKSRPDEGPKAKERFEHAMKALFRVPKSAVTDKEKSKEAKKKRD